MDCNTEKKTKSSHHRILCILWLLCLSTALPAAAQHTATVGFWNVENMFDTLPAPHYPDDDDYAPDAALGWNTERYLDKLRNVARIIDLMGLDIIGLAEVENEEVVRDLVQTLSTDYNYIHRTAGPRPRGRDMALLYKGDRFIPREVRTVDSWTSRSFLYVRGTLRGHRVDIVVCHLPSLLNKYAYREKAIKKLREFADSLLKADADARLIVMGDFNTTPRSRLSRRNTSDSLFCPLAAAAAEGRGTYAYNGRWLLYDNIYVSHRLRPHFGHAEIFVRREMLHDDGTRRNGYPHRTFTSGKYSGGASDHLPVFAAFLFK